MMNVEELKQIAMDNNSIIILPLYAELGFTDMSPMFG